MSHERGNESETEHYLRTRFLERVAHDIRGPVGVTGGALDELELSFEGKLGDADRALFIMARRGMKKVLRIADRLARAAQLENRGPRLTMKSHDLREFAQSSIDEARFLEGRRGIAVASATGELPCVVQADADWLGLVLVELVGNAIRHAKQKVEVTLRSEGSECLVVIEDDGLGIKDPPLARFTPSEEPRGLGLALSISRDILEAHGGRLEVESPRLGEGASSRKGTRVTLHLPAGPGAR